MGAGASSSSSSSRNGGPSAAAVAAGFAAADADHDGTLTAAELGALEAVLRDAAAVVRPGGRIVVLSYHSLEDRRVKRVLRSGQLHGEVAQDVRGNNLSPWKPLRKISKTPSAAEISLNSRARSAKLRAAERTNYPAATS